MYTPVPHHPAPAGPLALRFLGYELPPLRAGTTLTARIAVENAGTGAWRGGGTWRLFISYHWLDRLGNPIVWDGIRSPLPWPVAAGERIETELRLAVPMPPGPYRLQVDFVDEARFWLAELGNRPLELDVDVLPRLARRALAARVAGGPPELVAETEVALAAQEEPLATDGDAIAFLAAGCRPSPDWSRLVLDAHEEGYAAVGGSVAVEGGRFGSRDLTRELAPWAPGFGRSPSWTLPLLCPSLVAGIAGDAPWAEPVAGLPAVDPAGLGEPWLCDGRIRVAVAARALRRADRRRA